MLEESAQSFLCALANRDEHEEEPPRHPFMSKKVFRLSEAELTALHAKLDELIQEVTALGTENEEKSDPEYELTLTFYQTPNCD